MPEQSTQQRFGDELARVELLLRGGGAAGRVIVAGSSGRRRAGSAAGGGEAVGGADVVQGLRLLSATLDRYRTAGRLPDQAGVLSLLATFFRGPLSRESEGIARFALEVFTKMCGDYAPDEAEEELERWRWLLKAMEWESPELRVRRLLSPSCVETDAPADPYLQHARIDTFDRSSCATLDPPRFPSRLPIPPRRPRSPRLHSVVLAFGRSQRPSHYSLAPSPSCDRHNPHSRSSRLRIRPVPPSLVPHAPSTPTARPSNHPALSPPSIPLLRTLSQGLPLLLLPHLPILAHDSSNRTPPPRPPRPLRPPPPSTFSDREEHTSELQSQ